MSEAKQWKEPLPPQMQLRLPPLQGGTVVGTKPSSQCHLHARDQNLRVKPKYLLISGTEELCVVASWCCHCILWFEGVFRPVRSLHSYCVSSTERSFASISLSLREGLWGEQLTFFLMLSSVMGLSRTCSFKKVSPSPSSSLLPITALISVMEH